MLTTRRNSTALPKQQPSRPLPWLIAVAMLLAFLVVSGTAEFVLYVTAPNNSIYPHSLLAAYKASYAVWENIPFLPPQNPALAAALQDRLGRYHKGLSFDTVPVAVVQAPPTPTPSPTSAPTASPTSSPSPLPSSTATPSVEATTPSATFTPTSSPSPLPSLTSTAVARVSAPNPSASATHVPATNTTIPSSTPPQASTKTIAPTNTIAPTWTIAPTTTPPPTATATRTSTSAPNAPQPTTVPTATATSTATNTPTATSTATNTPTVTSTATNTPTETPSPTNTPTPVVSFDTAGQTVNEGVGTVSVPVRLSAISSQDVHVTYTVGGSAAYPLDHTLQPGTITIPAGQTSVALTFAIVQDSLVEATENVQLTLGVPDLAGVGAQNTYNVTIVDDDKPTVHLSSATYRVSEAAGTASMTVLLDQPSLVPVSVPYATSDITATAGSDYTPTSGIVTFAPGVTTGTITVPIHNDLIYEGNEDLRVSLSVPTNAVTGTPNTAILTIIESTALPHVSFTQAVYPVMEGASETITVTLDRASTVTTVDVGVVGGSATANADYIPFNRTLRFNATSVQTFTMTTIDDTTPENLESVLMRLTNMHGATNGSIMTSTVAIMDNDPPSPFQFTVDSFSVEEDNASNYPITIHISPTAAMTTTLYVSTTTFLPSPGGTITAAADLNDYVPLTTQPITVPPGTAVVTVPLTIIADHDPEPNEGLTLTVRDQAGRTGTATVDIIDDDTIVDGPCTTNMSDTVPLTDSRITTQDQGTIHIECNSTLTIDLGTTPITTTSNGYELAYREELNGDTTPLDWMSIQVAETANGPWYTVFYWGDQLPDDNTLYVADVPSTDQRSGQTMGRIARDARQEKENLDIKPGIIYIDVDKRAPAGTYKYVRILSPKGGSIQSVDVDMVNVLTPATQPTLPTPVMPTTPAAVVPRRIDLDAAGVVRVGGGF